MADPVANLEDRVLVLAPTARDGRVSHSLLADAGIRSHVCATIVDMCLEVARGAGAVLVTAEAFVGDGGVQFASLLKAQPHWSDLTVIVLTPPVPDSPRLLQAIELIGPVTLMKRPLQVSTLLSTVRGALRDRLRQYEVRDLMAQREQAAEVLRLERERYRVTLSSIGDAVIATDTRGRVTFLNPVAEALTGWAAVDALGQPLTDVFRIVNESTRCEVENPALQALATGVVVGLANHTLLIARDGTERPIDDSAAPIGADGSFEGAVLVFRDITERKRADESRARLAAILESSDDAIIGKTLDGVIRYWNVGAERVFGYTADQALGQSITLIIPPDRLDEEREILHRIKRGERIDHFETIRQTRDGQQVDISLTVSPIRDTHGTVIGASKVARDVTERKRAEAERARLAETLRLALDASDLGTWEWNPATDSMILSPRAGEIYGIAPGVQHGREELRRLLHPDYRDRARIEAARSMGDGVDYDIEYPLVNGRWVAARGRGVYGTDGTVMRMTGVVQDVTARKQAEEALRISEGRHRILSELAAITESLTDPMAIMAASARLLAEHLKVERCAYAEIENESIYVITGDYTRGVASIVGRWPVAAFGVEHVRMMLANEPYVVEDADTDPRIGPDDLSAYRATSIRAVICVPLLKDGLFTAAMAVHQTVPRKWTPDEIDIVSSVVGRCWEALERARVNRALRDSEERHRVLVNATSDVVYRMSADWSVMYPLDGRQLVASNTAPIRDWLQKNIPPFEHGRIRDVFDRAFSNKTTFEIEHQVLRTDGAIGWTFSRAVPILDAAGNIIEWFGTARDITDRKEAEHELARVTDDSERRKRLYETILSAIPDFVYVFSLDHRVLYANDSLIEMWGRGRDGAIGKTFLEIGYEPRHAEMHVREIDTVRATKMPIRGEVPFHGTHGRRIYDYIFVPVFGSDGEVEAVAGTTRDVTDRKGMEDALRENDRKKDDFIALLAHELRNPLAPIRNGLQVMRLSRDEATRERSQAMMDRQLAHMVRMIDDLLDVSRIGRNKMELRRTRVSLAEVVDSAVETARPVIEEAGHQLTVSLPRQPIFLDGDLTRLSQVLSNLLTNSAKYTGRGGTVRLAAESRGARVMVSVCDNGIGIPAHALPTIFDMFSQVNRPIERSTGGLGIGLALVKGLVEMHGGTVEARSDGEGLGSTFSLTLPVMVDQLVAAVEPSEDRESHGRGRRVLVVDDNHDGAGSMADMLRILGHQVDTAHDGLQAIEHAERFRPEIILMDIGMPVLNGLDATRRIRAQPWGHGVVVIALTGWGQDGDRERSREAGCDGHLVKPVSLTDLVKTLSGMQPNRGGESAVGPSSAV